MTVTALIPSPRPAVEAADRWEIVTRAQAGDQTAWDELYRLYQDVVYRYVYARTTNRHLAEDLTQDVFARAIKSIGSVSYRGSDFGAWLVTIARNIVWDHYKSGRRRYEVIPGVEYTPEAVDDDRRADPEKVAAFNAVSAVLSGALAQLPADQRHVLALRYGAGMSVAETASAMGKTEGAVKAAAYRATQTLARLLAGAEVR